MGDDLTAAEMANNRSVVLLQAKDAAGALEAVLGTEAIFAAANDGRRQGMALGNQGAALKELGRLEEALEAYHRADDLLTEAHEYDLRSHVEAAISEIKVRQGEVLEGAFLMQNSIMNMEKPNFKQRLAKVVSELSFRFMK